MRISSVTPSSVWGASSRSLTNIGSGAIAATGISQANLATGTTVDLRPSAGTFGTITAAVQTGAAATAAMVIRMFDGTNTISFTQTAAAASAALGFTMINVPGQGCALHNNDGAVIGIYITSAFV